MQRSQVVNTILLLVLIHTNFSSLYSKIQIAEIANVFLCSLQFITPNIMQNGEKFARIESQEKLCPDLTKEEGESISQNPSEDSTTILYGPKLKSTVQWILHPDGYWILRNSEGVTCLQVDNSDKEVMSQFGLQPIGDIADVYDITLEDLQYLLRMLAETGMLEGTQPPKPPPNKFNLQQLLCFQIPLFNPDAWLTKHTGKLRWIWTWQFCFFYVCFNQCFSGYMAGVG